MTKQELIEKLIGLKEIYKLGLVQPVLKQAIELAKQLDEPNCGDTIGEADCRAAVEYLKQKETLK